MTLRAACLVVITGVAPAACTDAELCIADPHTQTCAEPVTPIADNAVTVKGLVCTVDPDVVVFPYKILFVIDQSGSNEQSDPNDLRAAAVGAVIEQYIQNPAVWFGAIGFSETAVRVTPDGFTRDHSLLIPGVVQSLGNELSSTDYLVTADEVIKFIEDDAAKVPEAERHRTRYDIQWLSDGIPDPCQRPEPILAKVAEIMALRARHGFYDVKLSTLRLYNPGYAVEGCEDVTPTDYLQPMAQLGHGTFKQATTPDDIKFEIAFTEIRAPFQRHGSYPLLLVNHNRVMWRGEPYPDSDGDGVRDGDTANEPDPTRVDADFDGCSDRVDEALKPNPAQVCTDLCAQRLAAGEFGDLDKDGLPDCAEQALGTNFERADTDLDGIDDTLELRFRTNPIDGDLSVDSDYDGVVDGEEILLGTDVLSPEASDDERYVYAPLTSYEPDMVDLPQGVSCFDFEIANVRLVETLDTTVAESGQGVEIISAVSTIMAQTPHRAGDNELCVYFVQTSTWDPNAEPIVTRACKTARYVADRKIKEPANGIIEILASDFVLFREPTAQ